MLVNAEGAKNIATACDKHGAKLIHISSDYVFDGEKCSPYSESDALNPLSVYGKSKQLSEEFVSQHCRRMFIVRTAWLYGYVGNNFVKTILNAAKQGQSLKVVSGQVGSPTNVADLAMRLLRLAETDSYGTYHCTNSGSCSWHDFAREFLKLSGLEYAIAPCTAAEHPRPAKRPAFSVLDNAKLDALLGGKMRLWQEAIADFMSHYDKITGEFHA
jgi:dTDP-4-dehydrorhamnose reductase